MGCPNPTQASGTCSGDSKGPREPFPELHPTRSSGQGGATSIPTLGQVLPFDCTTACASNLPTLPTPLGYAKGSWGGDSTMLATGLGTSRPCTEAEISSRSGSLAVKTRTPGRATQQIYSLGSGPGLGIQYQ